MVQVCSKAMTKLKKKKKNAIIEPPKKYTNKAFC
jgi:hypothetical protein